ncbi:GspH/FimT family protein [Synechococcus sp. ATX 2A4]|uniref:GspH/FimT family protein n=1 Tax=Synechococcus sp. ATX 2A4 TaxID=2823727 RepID=UPI0020CD214E|nr:GspH/FimT family protein [Synechococcus sp. ATX 2A4]MCP9885119.1 GspH/FimT family protein [Synechococcus sp. ATX 2A4]
MKPAQQAGYTLVEGVITAAILALLASLALQHGGKTLAQQRLEAATRRLALGVEQGRAAAEASGRPCALELGEQGWQVPTGGELPGCAAPMVGLDEGVQPADVALSHNLPAALRFSSNGLVLDGGTVVLSSEGTELRRCLVIALPLGVVRLGRYGGAGQAPPDSAACSPDPTL